MIIEVRKYTTKPGRRADFIEYFESRAIQAQRDLGMMILGPMLDLENPDVLVWLRGFPSLEERDRMKAAFYDGPIWKQDLEPVAIPLLARYDEVILTETTARFATF